MEKKVCPRGHEYMRTSKRWCPVCQRAKELERKNADRQLFLEKSCKRTSAWNKAHPEARVLSEMVQRCTNTNCKSYKRYGGRGISVCSRWRGDGGYRNFISDMGPRPSPKHSIDRIDNSGDYEPSNCRWALKKVQANNTRTNRFITVGGRTQTLAQWSEETGIPYDVLRGRINRGRPIESVIAEGQR